MPFQTLFVMGVEILAGSVGPTGTWHPLRVEATYWPLGCFFEEASEAFAALALQLPAWGNAVCSCLAAGPLVLGAMVY